ncbi:MAG TPA: YaeQ family protein [Candidatus Manganitrophaceae bacterium]|nr:YaeQ family protein [Candidatus Manganitrophaceae bacterium]
MASNATIFKASLQISDIDRHYYQDHSITLARHPSETDERMMVRLLAFVLHADEALSFGRGLAAEDEPDLWKKDLTGNIDLWIEVGQRDERRIRQACGRAKRVVLYTYGGRIAAQWWEENREGLARLNNLTVMNLPPEGSRALEKLAQRTMQLQCTVQGGEVFIGEGKSAVQIGPVTWKSCSSD